MTDRQPHPKRCETCEFGKKRVRILYPNGEEKTRLVRCSTLDRAITHEEADIISLVGCASHSSAPAPMADHKAPICENCGLDNTTCRMDMAGCLQAQNAAAKAERERVLDLIRTTDGGACPYELCRSGNGHDGLNCRDCLVKWIEESLSGGEQG